jgi:hypothetical protein
MSCLFSQNEILKTLKGFKNNNSNKNDDDDDPTIDGYS